MPRSYILDDVLGFESHPHEAFNMASFQYCLNSSTIKPTPILDKIRIAAKAGYEGIELWHDDIDLYLQSGGQLGDIRKALDDHGVHAPTTIYLKGWFDTTGEEHARELDEIKRRLAQTAAVGAPHAIAGPPAGKADHTLGAKNYFELLEIGRQFGVKPAMEYLGFVDDINSIEAAWDVIQQCGHPDATIVIDPFHCYRGGGPMASVGTLPADKIAVSHFNDSPASPAWNLLTDADRVMPGEGVCDLKLYCDGLKKIGYRRWLSLELFRPDLYERDALEVAQEGLEKMRAVAEA